MLSAVSLLQDVIVTCFIWKLFQECWMVMVSVLLDNSSPALSNNALYSDSVRSQPGRNNNISKSRSFPMEGSLPFGSTISTTSTLPPVAIALRQYNLMNLVKKRLGIISFKSIEGSFNVRKNYSQIFTLWSIFNLSNTKRCRGLKSRSGLALFKVYLLVTIFSPFFD